MTVAPAVELEKAVLRGVVVAVLLEVWQEHGRSLGRRGREEDGEEDRRAWEEREGAEEGKAGDVLEAGTVGVGEECVLGQSKCQTLTPSRPKRW